MIWVNLFYKLSNKYNFYSDLLKFSYKNILILTKLNIHIYGQTKSI